ncbi:hypothetical protein OG897_22795 [Streptomyces sp. NBC_00237]|uniref:hypothetical protein n=1 Tax=Streptomyces sp. NBC_00237 TaxID=2975687 RepID=UPI0022597328|nr:hypothetical protein [Streptomyces sp. NBC_00237]MCX5204267.1 hypothetical protein [Streptomyces sp. NBC_00237]
MSHPDSPSVHATGALLLCRAPVADVRPALPLLRERVLLAPAGDGWSVVVPEGKPWLATGDAYEPVDRVLAGWASALAIGTNWPVLALWWDPDRAGYTLASGFRRTVGYEWLADGTPLGEDEAMRTFAVRLGLDPVHDMESLEALTGPDDDADARARLLGLIAVLHRAGLALPVGLTPGESADRLRAVARVGTDTQTVEWSGWRDALRAELDWVEQGPLAAWVRGPRARAIGAVQVGVGVPMVVWGVRRGSAGWVVAGGLMVVQGAVGLTYDRVRTRS